MKTSDFDYALPEELIAQEPMEPRDHSRLLVLHRSTGRLEHRRFYEIGEFLEKDDVLVFNDSRVIPARLLGKRAESGGGVELLLLRRVEANLWESLVKPGKRLRPGSRIDIIRDNHPAKVQAEVAAEKSDGVKLVALSDESLLPEVGQLALPPYIHTPLSRPERYQTVYGRVAGSVAAPTAGLHFTPELIAGIEGMGVRCLFVTLHVGLDTFRPVREDDPREHSIHREYAVIDGETAAELSRAKAAGSRIICVGTTTTRIVEHAARAHGDIAPFAGWVDLFILPGYRFRVTDAMVTNFHLPRSTLLMLVSAFAGTETIRRTYREAIGGKYRFYSFGDAMLIV